MVLLSCQTFEHKATTIPWALTLTLGTNKVVCNPSFLQQANNHITYFDGLRNRVLYWQLAWSFSLCLFILVRLWNFAYLNQARSRSWNKPVLSNKGKVSCPRKQREHWCDSFELKTHRLQISRSTHWLAVENTRY